MGVSLAWLCLPKVPQSRSRPSLLCGSGHCWGVREMTRYTGAPQRVCLLVVTAKGSNFGFCQSHLRLSAHRRPHTCSLPPPHPPQWLACHPTLPWLGKHLSQAAPPPEGSWKYRGLSLVATVSPASYGCYRLPLPEQTHTR